MNDMSTDSLAGEAASQPKKRPWLFWGCLTLLVVIGVIGAGVGYVVYSVYQYTSPEPVAIPVYKPKKGEVKAVEGRLRKFDQAVKAKKPSTVEVTADDLNALLVGRPEGERYSGKVFFRVEGDRVMAEVSLPLRELKQFGVDVFSERYLNGIVSFKAGQEDGKPIVVVDSITAGGRKVPESYVAQIRKHNLLEEIADSRLFETLKEATRIAVEDGKIIVEKKVPGT